MPRPLKVQKKRRFSKQRASRKVEDGSICRTDKPSSNVESRTVKFDEKRAAHSCFRPSVLRSNVSWTAEGGNSRSERVGLAVSKTRKMRASFASTLAKPPANRLRSPQRPHRSARDRHERNSRSSTRLPSLVKPLATARRQRAEKVRARAAFARLRENRSAERDKWRSGIKRATRGARSERGGQGPGSSRVASAEFSRRSRARSVSSPRLAQPRGVPTREPRGEGRSSRAPFQTRALRRCRNARVFRRAFRHTRRRRSGLSIARPRTRASGKLEGRLIRPHRASSRALPPASRGR